MRKHDKGFMVDTCPDCKTETLEELGTAGFTIVLADGTNEYHNRHDWRCTTCNKRFDKPDCNCNGTCKTNKAYHLKNK